MKKVLIFISFALFMGISLSSSAAFVSAASFNGSGIDSDTSTFTLPANTWAGYSLEGTANVWEIAEPYAASYFTARLTSDIGNAYIGDYADIEEQKYEAYGYTSGQLYCYHHAHSVTITATAWTNKTYTDAGASVSVTW